MFTADNTVRLPAHGEMSPAGAIKNVLDAIHGPLRIFSFAREEAANRRQR